MELAANRAALAAAILLSLSALVQAEDATTLDTVQVTANRSEQPVAETLASVTVLTRADIERSQAPDLIDLLARQAGVDHARSGGPGQASTVFMRGSNSNHTLVLVDGLRVNPATQGGYDFAQLPLSQIERIEIVRGARAALWGSDAIGGIVHIFTRDPSRPYGEARAGSHGRAMLAAGFGAGGAEGGFGVSIGSDRLDGFSATNADAGPWTFDPDDDGYRNHHLGLRGRHRIGTQLLSVSALATQARVEFDMGVSDVDNRLAGLRIEGELGPRWQHQLAVGSSSERLDTPAFGSRSRARRHSLDWIHGLKTGKRHSLSLGLNWSRELGSLDSVFSGRYDVARRNAAVFASWQGGLGRHRFELSARRDDNSQFGAVNTGNAGWGWQAGDDLRLRASWGQGFHAPTFNDLYYPFFSNPGLRPEHALNRELGLDWSPAEGRHLSVSAFSSRIRDLIVFVGAPENLLNIERVAIDGLELEYRHRNGPLSWQGTATWQDPRNALDGAQLLRRARMRYALAVDYALAGGATLGLDFGHYGPRPDFGARLPGHARLDLRATWPLGPRWTLEGRIENLADADYELVRGYNTPGRSGMLGLRYRGG